jgi:hypothetical protein
MQVGTLAVQNIFEKDVHYTVPLYQRPYVWNEIEQWQPLWDDLQALADAIAQGRQVRAHFLGATVQDLPPMPPGQIETRVLIDGQQRLTTLQLMLKAFRDIAVGKENKPYADAIEKLIRNDHPLATLPRQKLKVWPTDADQEEFKTVMEAPNRLAMLKELGARQKAIRVKRAIPDAYLFFSETIQMWLAENEAIVENRIKGLYSAIRDNVRLVVIDLDEKDDPQMIFETLNARGTPLLSADLVKNSLLSEIQRENGDVENAYQKYWRSFDTDHKFWRERIGRGHAQRARIETFLQHALTLMSGQIVSPSHLYAEYRDFVKSPSGGAAIERLSRLHTYGGIFKRLQQNNPRPRTNTFFERLRTLDVVTAWPFILALFERLEDEPEVAESILIDLESFLVRRMVCRLSTRGYGDVFAALTVSLVANPEGTPSVVRSFLLKGTAEADRWPSDAEFKVAWTENPLYENLTRPRLRMLLETMEAGLRNDFAETKSVPQNLTIEHIMPRGWREHWAQPGGVKAETRDRAIHTIGNLTLINEKLNPHQSNRPWLDPADPEGGKRDRLKKHSVLYLNKQLDGFDSWDETRIAERSEQLFDIPLAVWPRKGGDAVA